MDFIVPSAVLISSQCLQHFNHHREIPLFTTTSRLGFAYAHLIMAISRRSRPVDIALPPSNSGSESTSPTKATASSPSSAISGFAKDAGEPSPLSASYIPPPPGLNSPVSPMTPITPDVLGEWPKDKWDALCLTNPLDEEIGLSENSTSILVGGEDAET